MESSLSTDLDLQLQKNLVKLMKTSTNIEQTDYLFKLGYNDSNCRYIRADRDGPFAFTISDFLEILPPMIVEDWNDGLEFRMNYDSIFDKWYVGYCGVTDKDRGVQFMKNAKELIDALYELVCWYKKYIKK